MNHGLSLTAEDKAFIRANYLDMTYSDMARVVGFSQTTVAKFCKSSGLVSERAVKRPKKPIVSGLRKEVKMEWAAKPEECMKYLCDSYDYVAERWGNRRLLVKKDGRRSSSEKVLCDIYGITIIEK